MNAALAVMSKTPGHSPVKSRLAASTGTAFAVEMHRYSARATASVVGLAARCTGATAYWAVAEATPAAHAAWPAAELPGFEIISQCEGGLGERMGRLHGELAARHGAAILVGTDSPQMEVAQLARALEWLAAETPRLVLGPAADGGFWLFGGNRPIPLQDWSRVLYSRPETGAAFAEMIEVHGEVLTLARLSDVDVGADLEPLLKSLRRLDQATPQQLALRQWLEACPMTLEEAIIDNEVPSQAHRSGERNA